ncbi:MAG: ATP-binding protein [Bacilli bacterium]
MIRREIYLNQIIPFINSEDIKVITGIRRCGKSMILLQIIEELKKKNISDEQIIFINFESLKYADLLNSLSLYNYLKNKIVNKKMYFLFDEIQEVNEWEKVINSLKVDYDCDIYLTGSNSRLLSSELATYIAGRYVSFTIYPLSYKEVIDFVNKNKINIKKENLLEYFMKYGGFPILYTDNLATSEVTVRLTDIFSSIVLNDIVKRKDIRNKELLNRVIKFVFENIGNTFSANSINKFFKSQNRSIDNETVYNYLEYLEESFIVKKVSRYDLKGKEVLKTQEKFYVMDLGIRNINVHFKDEDIPGILENIVYLELLRRNYTVYVGKLKDQEVDFVCEKDSLKIYIQVTYRLNSDETIKREVAPLLDIKDNYKKYIITLDKVWNSDYEGITKLSLEDFLISNEI